jgi:gliding motility-associated-like protein
LVNAFVPDNGPVGSLSDDPDNPTDIDSDGDGNPDDPTVTDLPLSPIVLVIVAVDDDLSDTPVDGDAGGVISDFNVLDNDTLNGAPVDLTLVTLTSTPTGPLTINADGTVSVAPGTSPGTYIIDYTICEIANPTNCDTATVTVEVIPVMPPPPIDAVDDDFRANPVDGNFGGFVANGVLFVFDNDTLDGELLNPSEVTLTSTPTGPLTINADGTVSVAPNTREGTYTIDYTICEIANPNNCDTATVTVEVVIPPVVVNQMVTPNSDGRNDFLFIRGVQSARNNSLKVFNRWGIAVYEGLNYNNQNNVFDGRSRGRSTVSVEDYLPAGIYFYIFEYDFNNERVTDNGYLYLSK